MCDINKVGEHDSGAYTVIFIELRTDVTKAEDEWFYTEDIVAAIVRVRQLCVKQSSVN